MYTNTFTNNKLVLRLPILPLSLFSKPISSNISKPLLSPLLSSSSPTQTTKVVETMALEAVHVSDVPLLDPPREEASVSLFSTSHPSKGRSGSLKGGKLVVVGHRGNGMNRLQMSDPRMRNVMENSILSFNTAASFNVDFIEFDVQVTKDGCPIIFHDNSIFTEENGIVIEKNVTELTLSEFLSYGLQKDTRNLGKPLLRKTKDGKIVQWNVKSNDTLCTLQETFEKVDPKLGFNIELKFDDNIVYQEDFLINVLQLILEVVFKFAKERPIIFSSFEPDAALLMRKLQGKYPVFFLTDGGTEIYDDIRRNTFDEAMKLCLEGDLQGIVSEVKGIFRNPGAVNKIKDAQLSLFTYGTLNNVPESVYLQHLMGIDGVIVDYVQEITEAVNSLIKPVMALEEAPLEKYEQLELETKPQFSQNELSFLFKLIPELIQH